MYPIISSQQIEYVNNIVIKDINYMHYKQKSVQLWPLPMITHENVTI